MKKVFAAALLVAAATAAAPITGCYKNTTTRGVGRAISACEAPLTKDGLLCYPECKPGFKGVGPVCWQECTGQEVDTGAFCNEKIVGGDNSQCKWYDKCGLTFDKGCVKCPEGFRSRGCLCTAGSTYAKKSYGRGAGVPLGCQKGQQEDAGLCYPHCPASQHGIGPVCWGGCPATHPYSCGAMCLADSKQCAGKVKEVADDVITMASDIGMCVVKVASGCNIPTMEAALKRLMADFIMPICS